MDAKDVKQIERNERRRERLLRFCDYNEYLMRGLGKRDYVRALQYHEQEIAEVYGDTEVLEFLLVCPYFHPNCQWASLSRDLAYNATFACINLFYKHTFTLALFLPKAHSHVFLSFVVQKAEGPDGKSTLCIVFVPDDRFTGLGIPQTFSSLDEVLQHVYPSAYRVHRRAHAVE